MTHNTTKPSFQPQIPHLYRNSEEAPWAVTNTIVSLPKTMLARAKTSDLVLYQASSSHISDIGSHDVATPGTIQEAARKETDDQGSMRHFICQLLDTEESSQKSILQRVDQSFDKTPEATGFGTLITLPSEVRQQIWHEVLKAEMFNLSYSGSEPIRYMGGRHWHKYYALQRRQYPGWDRGPPFEKFNFSVFRPSSYSVNSFVFKTTRKRLEYAGFEEHLPRLTSHAVEGELEVHFLRNRIFGFECQEFLDTFLGQLSRHQAIQLRQISLVVFACDDCYVEQCWGRVIERLPKTINVVLITLDALHGYARSSRDKGYLNLSRKLIGKVLSAADVLRNQILRQLPHARVFLVGSLFDRLKASDRAVFETLSADKTWSNLDRKILV